MIILVGALLVSFIVPLALFFYLKNRRKDCAAFQKDCNNLLINGLLLGLPVFAFSLVCNILFTLFFKGSTSPLGYDIFKAFILEAFSEELMKYLVARKIIKKNLSEVSFLDLMTYTCIAAMGFELMEAFVYMFSTNAGQILIRGVTNMHGAFGLIAGFIIARGYKEGKKNPALWAIPLTALIHGSYNLCLSENMPDVAAGISLLLAAVSLGINIYAFFFFKKKNSDPYYTDPLFPSDNTGEVQ